MSLPPKPPLHLEHLPKYFGRPITIPVSHGQILPSDNKCPTCWRPYNTTDTDSSPPCHPLRLHACSHLIGSHCLAQYLAQYLAYNITTCGLCRTPFAHETVVPAWCTFFLGLRAPFAQHTAWMGDTRHAAAGMEPEFKLWWNRAHEDLCAGKLAVGDAVWMWVCYTSFAVTDTVLGTGFVMLSRARMSYALKFGTGLACPASLCGMNKTVGGSLMGMDLGLLASLTSLGILSTMGFTRVLTVFGVRTEVNWSTKWWIDGLYSIALAVASRNVVGLRGMAAAAGVMSVNAVVYGGVVAVEAWDEGTENLRSSIAREGYGKTGDT